MKKCNIITLYERKARNNYLAFLSAVMLLAFMWIKDLQTEKICIKGNMSITDFIVQICDNRIQIKQSE